MADQWQSIPGQWNPITGGYNLPAEAIGSKVGGGYLYPQGDVLGNSTGGGGNNILPSGGNQAPSGPSIPSYEDKMRGQIEGGYNSYFSQLDEMMNSLPTQADAQRGMVQSQLQQGQTELAGQQSMGLNDLLSQTNKVQTAQERSLKDVGSNIGNLMRAGNVYLGSRGAGDSSAADQMSFAYSKLGSQQRGNVMATTADSMNQIKDREFKLKTTYNTAVNQLKSEAEQKTYQIAQWLAEQQNNIRSMKAQGQLEKGKDMATLTQNFLNIALQQAQTIRAEATNKQAMLDQWAMNNATNISQLKANLGMVTSGFQAPQASYASQGFNIGNNVGANTGGAVTGYGGNMAQKKDQWGNIIG